MTKQEVEEWYILQDQVANGYAVSNDLYQQLLRLNHEVMALAHNVHNDNMMNWRSK